MPESPAKAVAVAALEKRYGALRALARVDLEVAAGESFGLVGANGAGKTTLIKCLLDLAAPDAGRVAIFGEPASRAASRRRLSYLPERFAPPHHLRGAEFLRAMLELAGGNYDAARAGAMLDALELDRRALEAPVRTLSKGMTQKLGLAACFLAGRELVVLDEPMSGLDPAARVAVKAVLRRLAAEGRTLFFTSHVLADVDELCGGIAVLERGAVRFRGTPAALRAQTGEANLEAAYLKCIRGEQLAHA